MTALNLDRGATGLVVAGRVVGIPNALGEHLTVDGLVGPASIAAARRHGFTRWRDVA